MYNYRKFDFRSNQTFFFLLYIKNGIPMYTIVYSYMEYIS